MGRLYIVPTPIGNLEDITLRALRVLAEVDIILTENVAHSRKLLTRFEIKKPLRSYSQHNKRQRVPAVLAALEHGDVALITSAGMPALADPGYELIQAVLEMDMPVDVLPGPNAAITAVVAAALPAPGFVFMGFLPRQASDRRKRLQEVKSLTYSLVIYEAPHRLTGSLRAVEEVLGDRQMVVARELTKLHQEVVRGSVRELIERYEQEVPRGEFTLVIAGAAEQPVTDASAQALIELKNRRSRGESNRTAVAEVARKFGLSRNETYRLWLEMDDGESVRQ